MASFVVKIVCAWFVCFVASLGLLAGGIALYARKVAVYSGETDAHVESMFVIYSQGQNNRCLFVYQFKEANETFTGQYPAACFAGWVNGKLFAVKVKYIPSDPSFNYPEFQRNNVMVGPLALLSIGAILTLASVTFILVFSCGACCGIQVAPLVTSRQFNV